MQSLQANRRLGSPPSLGISMLFAPLSSFFPHAHLRQRWWKRVPTGPTVNKGKILQSAVLKARLRRHARRDLRVVSAIEPLSPQPWQMNSPPNVGLLLAELLEANTSLALDSFVGPAGRGRTLICIFDGERGVTCAAEPCCACCCERAAVAAEADERKGLGVTVVCSERGREGTGSLESLRGVVDRGARMAWMRGAHCVPRRSHKQ